MSDQRFQIEFLPITLGRLEGAPTLIGVGNASQATETKERARRLPTVQAL